MTWRRIIHYGLTAGLSYHEMGRMPPGLVCDLYIMRQAYDDDEHGVSRPKDKIYD